MLFYRSNDMDLEIIKRRRQMEHNCKCGVEHTPAGKVEAFMGLIKTAAEIRKTMTEEERIKADAELEQYAEIA